MIGHFTLDYWIDDGWHVGKLREVPGVFSQGEIFEELKLNIKDAFALMTIEETLPIPVYNFKSSELQLERE
jgi:predicted RNase H-like HicB family nuclease